MKLKTYCLLFAALAITALSSCSKGEDPKNEPLVVVPEQVLTKSPLQLTELRFLQLNVPYYYKRGATGNNVNFDNEQITFKADLTGVYRIHDGRTYPITWKFLDAAKTKIEYVINYPIPMTVNWENIRYTANSVNYTEYYTKSDGTHSLAVGNRVHVQKAN